MKHLGSNIEEKIEDKLEAASADIEYASENHDEDKFKECLNGDQLDKYARLEESADQTFSEKVSLGIKIALPLILVGIVLVSSFLL